MGVERVHEASARQLLKDFGEIAFRDGELVDDFALRITGLANNIRTLGATISDTDIVKKMIQVAPPHLEQIVCSIETLLDVNKLCVEELTGRLRAIEQRKKKAPATPTPDGAVYDKQGRLLLAAEDWLARLKLKDAGEGSSSSGNSGGTSGDKKRGKPRRGRGGSSKSGDARDDENKVAANRCLNCGKKGHWAKDCCSKSKKATQAHVAEGDEEDSMLLMATTVVSIEEPVPAAEELGALVPHREHLLEAKLMPRLNTPEKHDNCKWNLNTGTSNHMTGIRSLFSEFDKGISDSVRFGDGSTVAIEGRGYTIVFTYKNGEQRALTGVYYIPRLTANMISVGQMDEGGCRVDINHGVLRIFDRHKKLLARRGLQATVGKPACYALHASENTWLWHGQFGHLGFDNLRKLAREELVRGLPTLEPIYKVCDACLAGKKRRAPFPDQARRRPEHALDLVHGDLCGLITPSTRSGNRYFLLLVDDMS
ncbi:hypothetical protein U9M48_034632 [Paspalum notatum var. saurae]|uniref:CCHC-type domain-containing protein n=1 Tax=Paspalum notatum var. saurae TaxID=547442 RepID=A0AAQ3U9F0_PASNO